MTCGTPSITYHPYPKSCSYVTPCLRGERLFRRKGLRCARRSLGGCLVEGHARGQVAPGILDRGDRLCLAADAGDQMADALLWIEHRCCLDPTPKRREIADHRKASG